MALKIEFECDMSGKREAVKIKPGMNLADIPLPEGWVERDAFPGGNVNDGDPVVMCPEVVGVYEQALKDGENARDEAYRKAMSRARGVVNQKPASGSPKAIAGGKPVMTSSFQGRG